MRFYIISWGFFTNKNDVLTTNMWVSTANMWIQSTQRPQRQHEIWVGLVYLCMSTLSYPIMLGTSIWTQPLTTGRFTPESSQSTKWRLCLPPLLDGCRAEKPSQRRSCWIWRTNSEKRAERDCTKEPWKQSRFGDCFMIVGSDIRYGPFSGSTSKSQEEWCFSLFLIGSFNLSIQEWIGDFGSFQNTSSRIQIILRAEHQAQKLVDVFNMVQSTTQYVRCSNDLDPSFTSKSIRSAAVPQCCSAAASSWAQLFTSTDGDRENDYPIIGLLKNLPETHGESFRNYVNNYMLYMLYGASCEFSPPNIGHRIGWWENWQVFCPDIWWILMVTFPVDVPLDQSITGRLGRQVLRRNAWSAMEIWKSSFRNKWLPMWVEGCYKYFDIFLYCDYTYYLPLMLVISMDISEHITKLYEI